MRYVIVGAGAVGGSIGGRLHAAGHEVVLVARGAHAVALRERGLRLLTPDAEAAAAAPAAAGDRASGPGAGPGPGPAPAPAPLPVPVVERPEELALRADDVLVLAVKTQDSVAALDAWADRPVDGAPGAAGGAPAGAPAAEVLPVLCAQNGVANERLALRRFRRVYGVCVWLPSQFLEPGVVAAPCAPLTGMLHLGRYPEGPGAGDATARRIAADLETARFAAPVVDDVLRWKYAKLLLNLGNAVDAACGVAPDPAADELRARARAEGVAVLAAAGIPHASEREQAELRGDRMRMRPLAGAREGAGGSSWQSLSRGTGTIEADYLNGEIVLLGRLHGVPTPVNEALRRAANTLARDHRAPGTLHPTEVLDLAGRP